MVNKELQSLVDIIGNVVYSFSDDYIYYQMFFIEKGPNKNDFDANSIIKGCVEGLPEALDKVFMNSEVKRLSYLRGKLSNVYGLFGFYKLESNNGFSWSNFSFLREYLNNSN